MKEYKLLQYHMNCNPDYIFGHAEIAGKLATNGLKTFKEYKKDCQQLGLSFYNEDLYNLYMKESGWEAYNIKKINEILAQ